MQNETIQEHKDRLREGRALFIKNLLHKRDEVIHWNNTDYYSQSSETTKALDNIKLQSYRNILVECCKREFGGALGIKSNPSLYFTNGLEPSKGALRLWKKNVGGVMYYQIQFNKTEIELVFDLTPCKFNETKFEFCFDLPEKLFEII